jgi:hypothetical protein
VLFRSLWHARNLRVDGAEVQRLLDIARQDDSH